MRNEQPVSKEHPYLYHYTQLDTLRNLMASGELWASHYSSLNDAQEIKLFRPILINALSRSLFELLVQHGKKYPRFRKQAGGTGAMKTIAAEFSDKLVNSNYDVAFNDQTGNDKEAFAPPYIVSFCSHETHGDYVQRNGLLSQWRAYGKNGVCLVFNTKKLEKLLEQENNYFDYVSLSMHDAFYDERMYLDSEEFQNLVKYLTIQFQVHTLKTIEHGTEESDLAFEQSFKPFFEMATRAKHEGFREEAEVRIVAAPTPKALKQRQIYKSHEIHSKLEQKDSIQEGRRLALNTFPGSKRLPIERIIVAPMKNQSGAVRDVKTIIGEKNISVHACETPLIDRY